MESLHQTFLDASIRQRPVLIELIAHVVLSLLPIHQHIFLGSKSRNLLVVHILYKLRPTLQFFDALVRPIILLLKPDDPILDLSFLVIRLLCNHDGVHHWVVWLLHVGSADAY